MMELDEDFIEDFTEAFIDKNLKKEKNKYQYILSKENSNRKDELQKKSLKKNIEYYSYISVLKIIHVKK